MKRNFNCTSIFKKNRFQKDKQLNEAKKLSLSINLEIKDSKSFGIEKINPKTFLNDGNLDFIRKRVSINKIDLVFLIATFLLYSKET